MKKYIIIISSVVLAFAIIIGGLLLWIYSLPHNVDSLFVEIGCAKIKEENKIEKSPGTVSFRCTKYDSVSDSGNIGYMKYIASVLRTLNYSKTDDKVTDIEAVKFSFRDSNNNELWTVLFAYDFYQERVYALKNGVWYTVKEDERLNTIIGEVLDNSLGSSAYIWRGQSTFAFEEFDNTDISNPSFRYNLYWTPKDRPNEKAPSYKNSGFTNTSPVEINGASEAIARAAQELGFSSPVGFAFYDETCGYWMVELYDDKGYESEGLDINAFTQILYDEVVTLVMDDSGITLEIYKAITRYYPFLQ